MIIVEALLVLAVLAAIGYPVLKKGSVAAEGPDEGDERHKLLSAKEAAFVAIKDLDYDYRTGKIDEEDYRELKAKYESEAAATLRRLDGVAAGEPARKAAKSGSAGRFCTACGAKADAADHFCRSCGNPLK